MSNIRIDKYLAEKKYFESREKARTAILAGYVTVNGTVIILPSHEIREEDAVTVRLGSTKFVSRGGYKLEKALQVFNISLEGKTVLDAGASTGGFTDCALQHGATKVFAIDVGTAQLHHSLINNPQVISKENTDIRNITPADINNEVIGCLVADLSFISLTKVMPSLRQFITNTTDLLLLVKPQFETGKKKKTKKGIIKDEDVRKDALEIVIAAAKENGLRYMGSVETDVDGRYKNIEYMVWFKL